MMRFTVFSLLLSLLSGCVLFTEEPMGACWGLLCGDCIASGCTWDTRDRRCVVANGEDPMSGANLRRTQMIARCPAEQREVRVDASFLADVRCGARACEPCADEEGCGWDLLDSVCRVRGSGPVGNPVAIRRRDCALPDAAIPGDVTPVLDVSSDTTSPPDASIDAPNDGSVDAFMDVASVSDGNGDGATDASVRDSRVDAATGGTLRLRVVNALSADRAIDLCVGPIGGPSTRLIESGAPGGLRRAFRTGILPVGTSLIDYVATVVDAGSTACASATTIGAPIIIDAGPEQTLWFVVHDRGVTRFPVDTIAPATLRLRWLMVAATAGSPTFEYDLAGRGTISWTVRDSFGFNADTMVPSYVTAYPAVPATSRLRATMVGGATTVESLRTIPTISGSFTAVLVQTPPSVVGPAQFLLLNEGDTTATRSAVW
jgi:hypothetical protein